MNAFWDKLSKRQQLILSLGGAAALALLLLQFLLLPFLAARKTLDQAIRNNEKTLGEMMMLSKEYQVIKRQSARIQQALARRPKDFTLFSSLEKIAGNAGVKSSIKNINAGKGVVSGTYEELPVEIRLDKITVKQLTDFLYLLESPQDLIRIRKIAIAKMKESPEYLSTQIEVVTFQLTKGAGQ